ncbi:putative metalloprotease [Rhodobacter aestuarii]|uniref:Putative metalloprotease n=1 Tax=Rhodobacter aestuarii TaxID=453582 RepID=A0A1N7M200_9RHOB|nr:putative metalloprotease [Rhodobacter aestuarii]SIS80136.1 putative metalloprotease [Rhodobacter aestuarii]
MVLLLRLLPFLLLIAGGLVMWHFSARATMRKLTAESRPLNDTRLAPYLERLRTALGVERLPVFVYEIPQVNGLAAPDGRVFLTEGFMELYRAGKVSPEELTSVIAHEIGHVARGHAKRRMLDFSGQNLLRVLLAGVLGRFIPFIGPWIANLITAAVAAKLSQKDEYEADEFASALLIKAGVGAEPQLSLFEKLDALTGARAGATPAWLLSHPATEARMRAIRSNVARWNGA